MKTPTVILSRQLAADEQSAAMEEAIVERFRAAGVSLLVVPHVYHISEKSDLWSAISKKAAEEIVVFSWLHPRPIESLLKRHGLNNVSAHDLRGFESVGDCLAAIQQAIDVGGVSLDSLPQGSIVTLDEPISQRWYPVVDESRCINCHHCLQFCLFGVYTQHEQGRLVVQDPDRCKAGCPACSRICPKGAIMFPLYQKDAAIAGAPGLFMSPDLPARRMFYTRTKRPCPACGRTQHGQNPPNAAPESICPECGGVRPEAAIAAVSAKPAFDDLDALVDQLDEVMRRKP